jgi:hypothetical protein
VLALYAEHVYHLYMTRVCERDVLRAFLAEQGIETGIHYPISMMFGLKNLSLNLDSPLYLCGSGEV